MQRNTFFLLLFLIVFTACESAAPVKTENTQAPLSLWNESKVKTDIIAFVKNVTNENSVDFVPVKERIAVFDNDGTLWNEKPLYIPVEIELAYIKKVFPTKPEWQGDKMYSAIASDNLAVLTVVNWIRKNPCHSFPKRKNGWIKTIGGSRHLNCVKIFNSQTRRSEKHYINEENIFNLLLTRGYFSQINNRIYCERNKIDNESVVYRCGKRHIEKDSLNYLSDKKRVKH
jgi:hypothetical protein